MADRRDSFQLVTIAEATRILGVSDSTVRRLLRAGRLESQRVERPQGHVWLVRVPTPATDPPSTSSRQLGAADGHPSAPAPALAAWMTSVLEPLVTELGTSRQRIEALAIEVGTLRATVATLEAQNAALAASTATQAPDPSTEPPEPLPWPYGPRLLAAPWWWRYWPALLVVGAVLLALAVLAPAM